MYQPQEGTTGFWGLRLEPCDCQCHQPGVIIIHFMPCCENGFRQSNRLEILNPKIIPGIKSNDEFQLSHKYKPGDIFSLPEGYGFEEDAILMQGAEMCSVHEALDERKKKVLRLVKLNSEVVDFVMLKVNNNHEFPLHIWDEEIQPGEIKKIRVPYLRSLNSAHSFTEGMRNELPYKEFKEQCLGEFLPPSEESQEELVKKLFYLITEHGYKKALESFHIQPKKQ